MLKKILDFRLISRICSANHSIVIRSKQNLAIQLKQLNDSKQYAKTLELFEQNKEANLKILSSFTITQALKACVHLKNLQRGLNIYRLTPSSLKEDSYILTSVINLYMHCGDVTNAELLFKATKNKTLSMYGSMMKGYITNKMSIRVIDLYKQIQCPNEIIINLLFNACADSRTEEALGLAKQVFQEMPKTIYSNDFLLTSLVDALSKCKDVQTAQFIFDAVKTKSLPLYGAMMKGFVENNLSQKAIDLYKQIRKPSEINVIVLLAACADLSTEKTLHIVRKVSTEMPKSYYLNPRIVTSLLVTLMKCKDVEYAQYIFDETKQKTLPMYGAMMKGLIENNLSERAIILYKQIKNPDDIIINLLFNACAKLATDDALQLVRKVSQTMPKICYSNDRILTSLFDAFIKCRDCLSAEKLFSKMDKSVVSYGNIMTGFNDEKNPLKTLNLFDQMKINHVEADSVIYLCVIKALSQIGDRSLCKNVLQDIPQSLIMNHQIQNALVDMWGKSGHIKRAKQIFDRISSPDEFSYAAMIHSFGINGMGTQAIEIYSRISSELTNEITNICILNACSHAGLADEARLIFKNINNKSEKVYTTMIDCLSRASFFDEAQTLIDQYEQDHSPSATMYMALLAGVRNTNNSSLSQMIYDRMKNVFPQMTDSLMTAGILLANVYASSGDIDKSTEIRIDLNKSSHRKTVGLSWTSVNGRIFEFRAHDRSHPRSSEIYAEIEKISQELIEHGHEYDSSWITRPLQHDETVASVLCGHSERLAIAWNFVVNPNPTQIQITKNLRVCGDCHRATKLIAQIRQCEIIVRDANRIHHFYTNGKCSCNDFF